MLVRIYQPSKTAMQSGRAGTKSWVLEPDLTTPRKPDPLMGWVGSSDTMNQVKVKFSSKEEAIEYARRHGMQFTVQEPKERQIKPKAYADNFSYKRKERWTH